MAASETETRITPDDIRHKLEALQGEVQGNVEDKKPSIALIAAGGGILLLAIAFLLGKRAGKRKSAIVEIRRY